MAAEHIIDTNANEVTADGAHLLDAEPEQMPSDQKLRGRRSVTRIATGVPGDVTVLLSTGQRAPIRDLVNRKFGIWTMSPGWKIVAGQCADTFSVGKQPVFKVTLASGRILRATAKQSLLGATGWVSIADLKVKDRVAIAREIPEPAMPLVWQEDHLLLLGHMSGDGSYLKHQPLRYTSESEENLAAVREAAERAFGVTVNRHEGVGNWNQLVFSGNGNRWHPSAMNKWFRDLGIFDQHSHIKHLPHEVFSLSNEQIAYLLQHSWATDGCVYKPNPKRKDKARIYFATCSRKLIDDIAVLLLRLGFVGRIHRIEQKSGSPVFNVDVSGADNQKRFLEVVGAFGPRSAPAQQVLAYLENVIPNTNVDTIPKIVWEEVKASMRAQKITMQKMAELRGKKTWISSLYKNAPSRTLISELAEILKNDKLRQWAGSELFWDKVLKIEPDGEEEVYTLIAPDAGNWLNDRIICRDGAS